MNKLISEQILQIEKDIKYNKLDYENILDIFLSLKDGIILEKEIKFFNQTITNKRKFKQNIIKTINDECINKINKLFEQNPLLFNDIIFLFFENNLKIDFIKYVYDYIELTKNILFIDSILSHIKKDYFQSNTIEKENLYQKFKDLEKRIKINNTSWQKSAIEELKNDIDFSKEKIKYSNSVISDNIFSFSNFLFSHPCVSFEKYLSHYTNYNQDDFIKIEYSFNSDQLIKIKEAIKLEKLIYKYSYLILLKNEYHLNYDNFEFKQQLYSIILSNIIRKHNIFLQKYIIEIIVDSIILFLKGDHLNIFDLLPIVEKIYKISYNKNDDYNFKSLIIDNEVLYNNQHIQHIYLRNNSIIDNIDSKQFSFNIKNNFFHNKIHEEHFQEALSMFVYEFIYTNYIIS